MTQIRLYRYKSKRRWRQRHRFNTRGRYEVSSYRKIRRGEVMIAQFTDHTSAMKIRGKCRNSYRIWCLVK